METVAIESSLIIVNLVRQLIIRVSNIYYEVLDYYHLFGKYVVILLKNRFLFSVKVIGCSR